MDAEKQSSCKLWKMLRLTDFDQLEKLTKRSALATSCAYFFNNSSNCVTSSDWVGKCGHFQIAAPFQRANCTDQTDTAADKSRRANIQEKFFGSGSRLLLVLKILYEKSDFIWKFYVNTKVLYQEKARDMILNCVPWRPPTCDIVRSFI